MCYFAMDMTTGALLPAVLLWPAPRLPLDICPRCYGSGVEYVRDWMGLERPFPCSLNCEDGQRAKRSEIIALDYDVFVLPVERQMEALGAEARGDAWYYRSLLEADAAQDRRDKLAYAVQGL